LSVFALLSESFINSVEFQLTSDANIYGDQLNNLLDEFFSEFNDTTYKLRESLLKVDESAKKYEVQFNKCKVTYQSGRYFFVIPTEATSEELGDQIIRKADDLAGVVNRDYKEFKELEKKRKDMLAFLDKHFSDSSYLESDPDVGRMQKYIRLRTRYGKCEDKFVI